MSDSQKACVGTSRTGRGSGCRGSAVRGFGSGPQPDSEAPLALLLRLDPVCLASLLCSCLRPAQWCFTASDGSVGFDMRKVRLHVSDDAVLEVTWLHGQLRPVKPGQPPIFDDQRSFRMDIEDAEIAIDPASLTAMVNHAFDYKGSSLSNLRVSFETASWFNAVHCTKVSACRSPSSRPSTSRRTVY